MPSTFVNPNRQGIVPDRLGPNTINVRQLASKAVITSVARSMLDSKNNSQRLAGGGFDILESLNFDKNVVRRICYVTVGGDALNESTLSHGASIHLASVSNNNIFDEVTYQILAPASNVLHNGVVPAGDETMNIIRKYDSETKQSTFTLDKKTLETIKEMHALLTNETPLLVSNTALNSAPMDEKRKQKAIEIIQTLQLIIGMQITQATMRNMMGVEESVASALMRHAVDVALLQVADEFADSLAETGAHKGLGLKMRGKTTFNAFCKAYCEKTVNNMFIMEKDPVNFIPWLSGLCDKFSNNMTSTRSFDPHIFLETAGGHSVRISKVLIVGDSVMTKLHNVQPMTRSGLLQIKYYDNTSFYTDSNRTMLLSQAEKKKVEVGTSAAGRDLLDMIKKDPTNLDGSLVALTPLAERVLNLKKDITETDLAAIDSPIFYEVPINNTCQAIITNNGGIVINKRNSKRLGPYVDGDSDKSVSGKRITNLVTTISLGDMDYDDSHLLSWGDLISSSKVTHANALTKFGIQDVTSKTEILSPNEVRFTKHHFAQAIADPSLWTYPVEFLENLNKFHEDKVGITDPALKDLRHMLQQNQNHFINKEKNMVEYYKHNMVSMADSLRFTELSPFHEYTWDKKDRKITHLARQHVGAFPAWTVDQKEHLRFANIALGNSATLTTLSAAAVKAKAGDDADLLKVLEEIAKTIFAKVDNIEAVIDIKEDVIKAMVIAPALKKSSSYTFDNRAVKEELGNWETRAVTGIGKDFNVIHHANLALMSENISISTEMKLLVFLGMLRKLSPYALFENAMLRLPFGLALDCVKVEKLYSNSVYLSTYQAVDVIVTPLPTVSAQLGDGSFKFTTQCRVQSVNNMLGGSCMMVPNALSAPRIDHISTDLGDNPLICLDHITTSKYKNSINLWISAMKDEGKYSESDQNIVKRLNQESENKRLSVMKTYSGKTKTDGYVLFLRPARNFVDANELNPYMGIPRYNCVVGEFSKMPFVNFYTTIPTINPWISRIGAVYNQRYVHNMQTIKSHGHNTGVKMDTMTIDPRADNLSETTMLLYNAFDFETYTHSELNPFDERVVDNHLNYHGGAALKSPHHEQCGRVAPARGDDYLASFHVLSKMGMSVPKTCYTNKTILEQARNTQRCCLSTDTGKCVISPLSLPRPRNS